MPERVLGFRANQSTKSPAVQGVGVVCRLSVGRVVGLMSGWLTYQQAVVDKRVSDGGNPCQAE